MKNWISKGETLNFERADRSERVNFLVAVWPKGILKWMPSVGMTNTYICLYFLKEVINEIKSTPNIELSNCILRMDPHTMHETKVIVK